MEIHNNNSNHNVVGLNLGSSVENTDNESNFDDDIEEEECRVCRGPVEEGRPLFKPCVCSGSIGLVHQDCLESWLKVQRRDGSCELCKTKFRFAPQYAENTPIRLPMSHVVTSLCRRAVARWLPLTIRSLFAASLWLVVAPLVTSYLYHGWMARPSALLERLKSDLLVIDLVSGAVVAACIIISFLSLMSFADFLRGEWQQRGLGPRQRGGVLDRNQANNNNNRNRLFNNIAADGLPDNSDHAKNPSDDDVDNGIWEHVQDQVLQQPNRAASPRLRQIGSIGRDLNEFYSDEAGELPFESDDDAALTGRQEGKVRPVAEEVLDADESNSWHNDDSSDSSNDENDGDFIIGEDELNRLVVDDDVRRDPGRDPHEQPDDANRERRAAARDVDRIDRPLPDPDIRGVPGRNGGRNNVPLMDFDQDEPIDMDINIALDELLGVRGPLLVVARNLLWLLAFNALFLGFFAFVPRTVGVAMSSILFNTTLFATPIVPGNTTEEIMNHFNISQAFKLTNAWRAIEAESIHQNTTLRLHDIATVALGYFSLAFAVIFFRYLWVISQKVPFLRGRRDRAAMPDIDDMREAIDEVNRLVHGLGHDVPNLGEDPPVIAISLALGVALDAMLAVVKVGILLFLKMFLLPIILGLTLDASTIAIFGGTLEGRVAYAGKDLFSFILLHWVAGITFMLLVTVSVLQLREVVHPDLLAQTIRPQEPQPDLLGNLMHESVSTHAKRMVLSLIIYAFLLSVHIYFPVQFYVSVFGAQASFFKIKLAYVLTPQLQVPLELLFFHLCMLALLEKYKNGLGGMQHQWLRFLSELFGLSDRILPRNVLSFRLVGSRFVFESGSSVDPFWFELSKPEQEAIHLLDANLNSFKSEDEAIRDGVTKESGERVLQIGADFIRLPVRLAGRSFRARSTLLQTKIGRYRLVRDVSTDGVPVIQLWEEVHGVSISRPPEGWDDLGAGGADVQGRWAWGGEKKSTIEAGIAARLPFFDRKQRMTESLCVAFKLVFLCAASWLAATTLLCVFLSTPLVVGRSLYFILRVPESWVHDPTAFCIGFLLVFPLVRKIARVPVNGETTVLRRLLNWMSRFRLPPASKALVLMHTALLWFLIAPLLLGFIYEIAFVKSTDWFKGNESVVNFNAIGLTWLLGSLLLYTWADLCIIGILSKDFRLFGDARDAAAEDNNADAEAAAWFEVGGGRLRLSWQGKHGRMARFWDTLTTIISGWEWDKVDEVNLIHNVAAPVAVELLRCVLAPITLLPVFFWFLPNMSGLLRAVFSRSVLAVYCTIQIGRLWKDQLKRWFEAAHATARDDIYLIGEILLNYGEQSTNAVQ